MILATAPISTESMPVFAKPWAVIKAFIPRVSCTKIVPKRVNIHIAHTVFDGVFSWRRKP